MKIFAINNRTFWHDEYKIVSSVGEIYGNLSFSGKIIRSVIARFVPQLMPLFYTAEFKKCGKTEEAIIIFDSHLTIAPANYIHRRFPNLRIIYWFWNHIYDLSVLSKLDDGIEKWSYDQYDAKKYGIKHNTQFYIPNFTQDILPNKNIQVDCVFVGKNKGRAEIINKVESLINNSGLSSFFHVVEEDSKVGGASNRMAYRDILSIVKSAKCIVDIVPKEQKGLSLRPLEALFFNKKLITTNKNIKNIPIYSPENVFIIGCDDINTLHNFVQTANTNYNPLLKDFYSIQNWLLRFND